MPSHSFATAEAFTDAGVRYAIATSGRIESARPSLDALGVGPETLVVTRTEVQRAKPDPDLFFAAAKKLSVRIHEAIVVGDCVWDVLAARRAGSLGIGRLRGRRTPDSRCLSCLSRPERSRRSPR